MVSIAFHLMKDFVNPVNPVEDEYHVLMQCPKYDDIRTVAFVSTIIM